MSQDIKRRYSGMDEATIEDLALPNRSSKKKRGQATFSDVLSTSREFVLSYRKSSLSPFFPRMFGRSEFCSRREERGGNGVKNLNGSEDIPEYFLIMTHTKWKRTKLIDTFILMGQSICDLNIQKRFSYYIEREGEREYFLK